MQQKTQLQKGRSPSISEDGNHRPFTAVRMSKGRSVENIIVHHINTSITITAMNEQRAQAYVNLIEQLLARADGEELNNILQANQELIDPQFLQVMEN